MVEVMKKTHAICDIVRIVYVTGWLTLTASQGKSIFLYFTAVPNTIVLLV